MITALFNQTFVIGSIAISNTQQNPLNHLQGANINQQDPHVQELLRNMAGRSPSPPPPKPYSGPPKETMYEFPADGGDCRMYIHYYILNSVPSH